MQAHKLSARLGQKPCAHVVPATTFPGLANALQTPQPAVQFQPGNASSPSLTSSAPCHPSLAKLSTSAQLSSARFTPNCYQWTKTLQLISP